MSDARTLAPPPSPAGASIVRAQGVSLLLTPRGRTLKVVDGLDLDIRRGEFFALVGESGSGKTMIARTLMRLLAPDRLRIEGRLALDGVDLRTASEATMRGMRGKVASMIFQEPMSSLNPVMTVGRQLDEALRAHGSLDAGARRARILQWLADVQFQEPTRIVEKYPHELSGGMRQRVMIAMALVNDPALLIADEPTTALDVTIQSEVMEILGRLKRRYGISIFFISHDLALVGRYADRIGVLYGGVLVEEGPAAELIAAPAHPYTAALLSCMPRRREPGARQAGIDGSVPRIDDWFPGCRFAPRCGRVQPSCREHPVAFARLAPGRGVRCLEPLR